MSDGFAYTEYRTYFEEESQKQKTVDRKFRLLRILVVVLAAIIIVNVILYAVVFPCFSMPHVVFSGLKNISETDLLKQSGMDFSGTWLSFDKKEFESRLAGCAAIETESIKVEKKFPDQILVHVTERSPVAFSLMNIDGHTQSVQIDRNGVVFNPVRGAVSTSVPLITGLELENVSEGFHIAAGYRTLLRKISDIMESNPVYLSALSEIHVRTLASGNYELVLYPIHSHVRVVTDHSFSEETLKNMMLVLDVIDNIDSDIAEIDMRYGSISYIKAAD